MAAPILLYTQNTPNGQKISIALEELGLAYQIYKIDFSKSEQKEAWYLKINPNGRIPAIVDQQRSNFNVFESGSIMLYLAEYYDPEHILLPVDPDKRSQVISWLFWQNAGIGPMQGQANHFVKYAPEKIPYAIKRYTDETIRLYQTLETQLSDGRDYIVGDFSAADIATFPWIAIAGLVQINVFEQFPRLNAWLHRMAQRPAVIKGMDKPDPNPLIKNNFVFQ